MTHCPLPALIKMSQIRELTGIPRSMAYELAKRGELQILKVGSRSYIPRASFEAFVARLPRATYRDGRLEIVEPGDPRPAA